MEESNGVPVLKTGSVLKRSGVFARMEVGGVLSMPTLEVPEQEALDGHCYPFITKNSVR